MIAPFPTNDIMNELKEQLLSSSIKIKDIKTRIVQAQQFENAALIRQVENDIEHLLQSIEQVLAK